MSKMILAFIMIFLFFTVGIKSFVDMSKSEKMSLTKWLAYSIVCSVVTVVVIAGIVLIF